MLCEQPSEVKSKQIKHEDGIFGTKVNCKIYENSQNLLTSRILNFSCNDRSSARSKMKINFESLNAFVSVTPSVLAPSRHTRNIFKVKWVSNCADFYRGQDESSETRPSILLLSYHIGGEIASSESLKFRLFSLFLDTIVRENSKNQGTSSKSSQLKLHHSRNYPQHEENQSSRCLNCATCDIERIFL